MKLVIFVSPLATLVTPLSLKIRDDGEMKMGTGRFPADHTTEESLPKHTIYMPVSPPANEKLPVVVWGNGGCVANGIAYRTFLTEIASHGYIAISAGAPHRIGLSNPGMMTESIEWAAARAGRGRFATMDATRVVAAGQSCGGLEAYAMKNDSRVAALGIYDSGYLNDTDRAMTITKPVFYFLGGSSDVAYKNGERDYSNLPKSTPAWKGNQPVGHLGTFFQPNG
ncbi:hypothetical protein MGG_04573 [Pyricularia oryzae 70-15]|uniref:Alpha/beta hydrolase fold-3 domain-containing protein n=2 Tax=Pyricularia oryzae TaxID=318829 RepID=G4MSU1_PYRO7|nr:uncharacterized protein MGG_04573 [Pyricularia oryzae 70-15]EHA53795.1 hypothetical protein MGG_04573 [Pyricularia oryzae 70-15]ELQ37067.1 hypothetical protein OOU_Y34scaffold00619g41 [Pyricularia oryzae Y34]KAI7930787.1 hypothetical protein M0657_001527 [Pyricularia oryzae]KAI7931218.1 hypothetical protein M9X92_000504 [Pyricularia oryzae]